MQAERNGVLKPSDKPLTLVTCNTPPKAGPELYVLRVKGDKMHTITLYSKSLWGVWVHFGANSKKSSPHFSDEARCPGCIAKTPKRWKGFVHGFCNTLNQEVFLELTPAAAASLLQQLGDKGALRGNRIQVKRSGAANGRLQISVLTACVNPEQLPSEKDPQTSLLKLWGYDDTDAFGGREFPRDRGGASFT